MTREEAIKILKDCELNPCVSKDKEAANMAINALEKEPYETVTEFADRCRECGREKVLDKLRAEIKEITPTYHNPDWSVTDLIPISEVLKLIDKYKADAESEA
jgi:hypothetical protein